MTSGVPLTTTDAICVTPSAGLLFQVMPVSVQLVSVTGNAAIVMAVPSLDVAKNWSFALEMVLAPDRSNFRYESRLKPEVLSFTLSDVAVPKLVAALEPSRTYASAVGDNVTVEAGAMTSTGLLDVASREFSVASVLVEVCECRPRVTMLRPAAFSLFT